MNWEQINPGLRYEMGGKIFEVTKRFEDGRVEVLDNFGTTSATTVDELTAAYYEFRCVFEKKPARVGHLNPAAVKDFREDCVDPQTLFRYKIVVAVDALPTNKRSDDDIYEAATKTTKQFNDDNHTDFHVPRPRTARGWCKTHRDHNDDLRSLAPRSYLKGARGKGRIDPRLEPVVEKRIQSDYLVKNGPTIMTVRKLINADVQRMNMDLGPGEKPIPEVSYDTLAFRIRQIPARVLDTIRGPKKARNEQDEVQEPYENPERAQEVAETDSSGLPIVLRNRDRMAIPKMIPIVDRLIDYCYGFYCGFEPSNSRTACMALMHAVMPKNYVKNLYPEIEHEYEGFGMIETLVTDQGREYIGIDMEKACAEAGIHFQVCPKLKPWYKGGIERFFREVKKMIRERFRGRGALYTKKPDLEKTKYKLDDLITLEEFIKLLHIWIVDEYNHNMNTGIGGVPAYLLKESWKTSPAYLPGDLKRLKIALGATEERTIQGRGVSLNSIIYNDSQLIPLRVYKNKNFRIKYDRGDLTHIFVLNDETGEYLKIPAVNQELVKGLTTWSLGLVKKRVRKEYLQLNQANFISTKSKFDAVLERPSGVKGMKISQSAVRFANQMPEYTKRLGEGDNAADCAMVAASTDVHAGSADFKSFDGSSLASNNITIVGTEDCVETEPKAKKKASSKAQAKPAKAEKAVEKESLDDSDLYDEENWVIGHSERRK